MMNERKLIDQVGAIFGVFMTLFYIGMGFFLIFADRILPVIVDKVLFSIVGFTFILYGIYRGFRTYGKITQLFFNRDKTEE